MDWAEFLKSVVDVAPSLFVMIGILLAVGQEHRRVIDRMLKANETQLDTIIKLCTPCKDKTEAG